MKFAAVVRTAFENAFLETVALYSPTVSFKRLTYIFLRTINRFFSFALMTSCREGAIVFDLT